ncbi:uncharacterized protein ACBT44_004919 isoform 1-T1 [Syngnathus typhle]
MLLSPHTRTFSPSLLSLLQPRSPSPPSFAAASTHLHLTQGGDALLCSRPVHATMQAHQISLQHCRNRLGCFPTTGCEMETTDPVEGAQAYECPLDTHLACQRVKTGEGALAATPSAALSNSPGSRPPPTSNTLKIQHGIRVLTCC